MSLLEIIERLREVTRLQADIIEKQTVALEQAEIADAVAAELYKERKYAADKLAIVNQE